MRLSFPVSWFLVIIGFCSWTVWAGKNDNKKNNPRNLPPLVTDGPFNGNTPAPPTYEVQALYTPVNPRTDDTGPILSQLPADTIQALAIDATLPIMTTQYFMDTSPTFLQSIFGYDYKSPFVSSSSSTPVGPTNDNSGAVSTLQVGPYDTTEPYEFWGGDNIPPFKGQSRYQALAGYWSASAIGAVQTQLNVASFSSDGKTSGRPPFLSKGSVSRLQAWAMATGVDSSDLSVNPNRQQTPREFLTSTINLLINGPSQKRQQGVVMRHEVETAFVIMASMIPDVESDRYKQIISLMQQTEQFLDLTLSQGPGLPDIPLISLQAVADSQAEVPLESFLTFQEWVTSNKNSAQKQKAELQAQQVYQRALTISKQAAAFSGVMLSLAAAVDVFIPSQGPEDPVVFGDANDRDYSVQYLWVDGVQTNRAVQVAMLDYSKAMAYDDSTMITKAATVQSEVNTRLAMFEGQTLERFDRVARGRGLGAYMDSFNA